MGSLYHCYSGGTEGSVCKNLERVPQQSSQAGAVLTAEESLCLLRPQVREVHGGMGTHSPASLSFHPYLPALPSQPEAREQGICADTVHGGHLPGGQDGVKRDRVDLGEQMEITSKIKPCFTGLCSDSNGTLATPSTPPKPDAG